MPQSHFFRLAAMLAVVLTACASPPPEPQDCHGSPFGAAAAPD